MFALNVHLVVAPDCFRRANGDEMKKPFPQIISDGLNFHQLWQHFLLFFREGLFKCVAKHVGD